MGCAGSGGWSLSIPLFLGDCVEYTGPARRRFSAFRWQLGARCSLDRCDNSRAAGVRFDRSFQANPLLVAHFVAPGVAPE